MTLGFSDGTGNAAGAGAQRGTGSRLGATSDRPLAGGRVGASGLVYAHAGELIVPGPDAEAEIDLLRRDLGTEIRITLPVVVQIGERDDDTRVDAIVDETLRRLRRAVEAQTPV